MRLKQKSVQSILLLWTKWQKGRGLRQTFINNKRRKHEWYQRRSKPYFSRSNEHPVVKDASSPAAIRYLIPRAIDAAKARNWAPPTSKLNAVREVEILKHLSDLKDVAINHPKIHTARGVHNSENALFEIEVDEQALVVAAQEAMTLEREMAN